MEKGTNNKLYVYNRSFYIYLIYTLIIILTDWINFLTHIMLKMDLKFGIAETISFSLILLLTYKFRNNVEIVNKKMCIELVIGIILILLLGIVTSMYPAYGFDTMNYHLIAQNPKFENYFVEDYGYGNFQVWGFRLADRLFYYFRYLFGYRLGTFLNILALIISFVQLYGLLEQIDSQNNNLRMQESVFIKKLICNKLVWSLAILLIFEVLNGLGGYSVDLLSLPIALEITRHLLVDREIKQNKYSICYYALLNGIWIGLKLTNIVYVIPFVIIYIYIHKKEINTKIFLLSSICGVLPYFDYMLFNYICTKNPVFPYYNAIFKSPYFGLSNFKDNRWGGQNVFEKMAWIIYSVIKPSYRQGEGYDKYPITLILGLVGLVIILVYMVFIAKRKINVQYKYFAILALTSTLIWSFTTGYMRYFIFGKILWGILGYYSVSLILNRKKCINYLCTIVSFLVISSLVLHIYSNISYREKNGNSLSMKQIKKQLSYVLNDNDIKRDYGINADLFMITDRMSMGIAELIDDSVFTINTCYQEEKGLDYKEFYKSKMKAANNTYDIKSRRFDDICTYIDTLNQIGLYIDSFENVDVSVGTYLLIKVEELSDKENNVCRFNGEPLVVDISTLEGRKNISFTSGRIYNWPAREVGLKIVVSDSLNNKREIDCLKIDNKNRGIRHNGG